MLTSLTVSHQFTSTMVSFKVALSFPINLFRKEKNQKL